MADNLEQAPIERIEALITAIANLQIAIEPSADAEAGVSLLGYKDAAGNPYKVLVQSANALVAGLKTAADLDAGNKLELLDSSGLHGLAVIGTTAFAEAVLRASEVALGDARNAPVYLSNADTPDWDQQGGNHALIEGINQALTALTGAATTQETHGWKYLFSFTVSFDDSTRTLTIDKPTIPDGGTLDDFYRYWYKGAQVTKTVAETIQIPDEEGLYLVAYDGTATLKYTKNPTQSQVSVAIREDIFVAYVHWNFTEQRREEFLYEGHTRGMQPAMHSWAHFTLGMMYVSGMGLSNFTIGSGSDLVDVQWGAGFGVAVDEDLPTFPPSIAYTVGGKTLHVEGPEAGPYPRIQDGATGTWLQTAGSGRLAINVNNGGTFEVQEAPDNSFVVCHMLVNNAVESDERWLCRMPQAAYSSLGDAEAGLIAESRNLNLGSIQEIGHVGSIILYTKSTYANICSAKVVELSDDSQWFDWRTTSAGGGSAGTVAQLFTDLLDVTITGAQNGEVVIWDSLAQMWKNGICNAKAIASVPVSPAVTPDTETVYGPNRVAGLSPVDTSAWTPANSTLAAASVDGRECLEGTSTVVSPTAVIIFQNTLVVGEFVHVTGEVKCSVATMAPRIRDASSGIEWTGVNSDDWQTVDFWATAANAQLEFRSAGTYGIGDTICFSNIVVQTDRQIQNTDKLHGLLGGGSNRILRDNNLTYAAWSQAGIFGISGTNDIVGSSTPGEQSVIQSVTVEAGANKIYFKFLVGAAPWVRILVDPDTVFIDLNNGVCGTGSFDHCIVSTDGTHTYVTLETVLTAGAKNIAVYLADGDNNYLSYAGDDSTIDLSIIESQLCTGTIADNTPYVSTDDVIKIDEPGAMLLQDDIAKKQAAGFLQQEGATGWGLPKCGDGIEWIAPLSEQHRGCGAKVFCQVLALSGLPSGTDTDILTISNAGKLVPRGSNVSFYNTATAQWWNIDGGGTSADTFYTHTKIGALNSVLQVRAGTNYATPNTSEAVIYYSKN